MLSIQEKPDITKKGGCYLKHFLCTFAEEFNISVSTLNVGLWNQDTLLNKWKVMPEEDKNSKIWEGRINNYAMGTAQKWAFH